MKLTKGCLYPWSFMQIHAGGMMQPCAVGPDTDLGDFLIDYINKKEHGCECDFLNNKGLQMLREGMLTGNLRPMCQNCFFVKNDLMTVEEFRAKLKGYLSNRLPDSVDLEKADLTTTYAYNWMAISFTNRCNLSCVYCVQSTMKNTNPYFKAEIPYKYANDILDMMAAKRIDRISTCVEGEATLYKQWQEVFSTFHEKYPHIEMYMTTNLNREYNDADLELLANYTVLDVSIDSLDPEKYKMMRVNGNLELLLKNLDKITAKVKELGIKGPQIQLHMVVSDKSWTEIEDIAEFAFAKGYGIQFGNYEERINTVAYRDGILNTIDSMSEEDQNKARDIIKKVIDRAHELKCPCIVQGDIFTKVDKSVENIYNRFTITEGNPVYEEFLKMYPEGEEDKHFNVVYDRDNISYAGIQLNVGSKVKITGLPDNLKVVIRPVEIYEEGEVSIKCNYCVAPGYRKVIGTDQGNIILDASGRNEHVESVLYEISEFWEETQE